MPSSEFIHDAVIIGGGFYGAAIAVYLARQRGMKRVVLVEREQTLLSRASFNNQARVHNGYHYPRSFTTAYRSRINFPRFVQDWPEAIVRDYTKLYGVARRNSKVTAKQFERFCREIGAPVQSAPLSLRKLFEPQLIEDVFLVEECSFDSRKLASWAERELKESGVQVICGSQVTEIWKGQSAPLRTVAETTQHTQMQFLSHCVFNCTYSGLNQLRGDYAGVRSGLKHEITEMALMKMPDALSGLGITVVDGPFFSIMPFPAHGLHTLSHVRYTPHREWQDEPGVDPYKRLLEYDHLTRVDRMIRDVQRYIPVLAEAQYARSMFEVKTILSKNESDDGRPILYESHAELPGLYSVLGGKIDNIYDVLEKLNTELLPCALSHQRLIGG